MYLKTYPTCFSIQSREDNEKWCFSVSDTGNSEEKNQSSPNRREKNVFSHTFRICTATIINLHVPEVPVTFTVKCQSLKIQELAN